MKDAIIVDDWDEVCRENTDIEFMYKEKGFSRKMVKTINDVICRGYMENIEKSNV